MGFLDKLKERAKEAKEKAVEAVDEHSPQIKEGIGKAGDFVDKKTKGKYSDKIAKGTQQAGAAVDKIKADDAAQHPVTVTEPPPPPTSVSEPVISDPAVTVTPGPDSPAPEPPGADVPSPTDDPNVPPPSSTL